MVKTTMHNDNGEMFFLSMSSIKQNSEREEKKIGFVCLKVHISTEIKWLNGTCKC